MTQTDYKLYFTLFFFLAIMSLVTIFLLFTHLQKIQVVVVVVKAKGFLKQA
jgi:hypothetical protein